MGKRVISQRFSIIVVALICLAVLTVYLLFSASGSDALRSVGALPEKEHVTELYLADYVHIPSDTIPAVVPFSFVIANHEGVPTTYAYRVYAVVAGTTYSVEEGEVYVADGESRTVDVTYRTLGSPATIHIDLVDRSHSIHFSIPRSL